MIRLAIVLVLLASGVGSIQAQPSPGANIAERTAGLQRTDGFVPFYWDAARGRVLMEIPRFDEDVLYYVSAASGAGSVELSFDRGIMDSSVIHFQRSGPRVLVDGTEPAVSRHRRTAAVVENVRDSFPTSVLAALPVEADEAGRVLVDATPLFMRDAANVGGRAAPRKPGGVPSRHRRGAASIPRG